MLIDILFPLKKRTARVQAFIVYYSDCMKILAIFFFGNNIVNA